jgi:purine-cytosine permease-like protein
MSSVPLMIAGAAIGGAIPNIPSWNDGYTQYSVGGAIGAMLHPAGGFGKFCLVLLALSMLGNMTGSSYAGTLNFQNLVDLLPRPRWLRQTPRAVYAAVLTVVIIPVAIRAAASFFDSLNNFVGVLGYWVGAFAGVVATEHFLFRKADFARYEEEVVIVRMGDTTTSVLTTSSQPRLRVGVAALVACATCFALVVPSMDQIWYAGPIAVRAGDIGFEMALVGSACLYAALRGVELKLRKNSN